MTKPFGFMELMARVEAVLRRCSSAAAPPAQAQLATCRFGDVTLDFKAHEAWKDGTPEDNPADPRHIITVHRLGYKFVG